MRFIEFVSGLVCQFGDLLTVTIVVGNPVYNNSIQKHFHSDTIPGHNRSRSAFRASRTGRLGGEWQEGVFGRYFHHIQNCRPEGLGPSLEKPLTFVG